MWFFNRPVVRILYTPNALATGWHLVPEYEKELTQRRHSFCDLVASANLVLGSRNPQNTRWNSSKLFVVTLLCPIPIPVFVRSLQYNAVKHILGYSLKMYAEQHNKCLSFLVFSFLFVVGMARSYTRYWSNISQNVRIEDAEKQL